MIYVFIMLMPFWSEGLYLEVFKFNVSITMLWKNELNETQLQMALAGLKLD